MKSAPKMPVGTIRHRSNLTFEKNSRQPYRRIPSFTLGNWTDRDTAGTDTDTDPDARTITTATSTTASGAWESVAVVTECFAV